MLAVGGTRLLSQPPVWRSSNEFWMRWSRRLQKPRQKNPNRALEPVLTRLVQYSCAFTHTGRVPPQCFQIVPIAHVLPHHMDNNIKIIQHDPVGLECAVDGPRPHRMLVAECVCNLI